MGRNRLNIYPTRDVRKAMRCRKCSAQPGELCWDFHGVQMLGCHRARHLDYERQQGDRPKRGWKGVSVFFVCPICDGPHARAECPQEMVLEA